MTNAESTLDLQQGDWQHIRVGSHLVQIANRDGEVYVNVRDHVSLAVNGEHKNDPEVIVEHGEYPTAVNVVDEGTLWERYEGADA